MSDLGFSTSRAAVKHAGGVVVGTRRGGDIVEQQWQLPDGTPYMGTSARGDEDARLRRDVWWWYSAMSAREGQSE